MQCLFFLLLMQHAALGGADSANAQELFEDPRFERGVTVTADRHPAPKVELGVLQTSANPAAEPPAWRLPQWGSRYLLQPGPCVPMGTGCWQAETPGKRFAVERTPDGLTRLLLEVHGGAEYDGKMRGSGEAWPHLLIEQSFSTPIALKEVGALSFGLDMRIPSCKVSSWAEGKTDPGLHTAQVSAFWTVHNVNPDSADYRDMIWFGIPLFDARYEIPPAHYALDGGKEDASGKFICLLDGKRFWTGNTGDGAWRSLAVDLVPLFHEALAISQEHGHLAKTRFEDLAITSFNLGWEVPGPYDAALELRGLSLQARAASN